MSPFLSIIVPFHNSAEKCRPLLGVLRELRPEDDVELIFVDDGSTDSTVAVLREFAAGAKTPVIIVERENGGPGAARNSGLDRATGQWIWFVDSDDVIDLDAVDLARASGWPDVDVIAWEYHHPWPGVSCPIPPGIHQMSDVPVPPDAMETIPAKWFALDFLKRTRLWFPEYCVYEATPIEAFVLPLLVTRYYKSDFQAYRAIAGPSVTRGDFDARRFDRLKTIVLGRRYLAGAELDQSMLAPFDAAFVRLFLWYSIAPSRLPGRSWIVAARVMRQYRDEAARLRVGVNPFDVYPGGRKSRLVARLLWAISAALPSQQNYFDRLRQQCWGREIEWTAPELPKRWAKTSRHLRAEAGAGTSPPAPACP
jgi:glycosyltransferase involved in cell wall biosynthesis